MTKAELVRNMAVKTGMTKKDIEAALAAFQETVTEAVAAGDKVALVGFGTFEKTEMKERTGRNPQTGETITIAAKAVPKFHPGKAFKDAVQ